MRTRARGFTLIEVLVATAIFALLAVMAYGALNTLIGQRERSDESFARLRRLERAVTILDRDLMQLEDRVGHQASHGDVQHALSGNPVNTFPIEFTRTGHRNPLGVARASLLRIAYRVEDRRLVRYVWPTPDLAPGLEPRREELLDGVNSFVIAYLDEQGQWQEQWPPVTDAPSETDAYHLLPRGIRVALELDDWGKVERLYEIAK